MQWWQDEGTVVITSELTLEICVFLSRTVFQVLHIHTTSKLNLNVKNFNTDQGHQVKTNNWKKTSETSSTANNNRRGRSQCKVRGWFSKSQIATYKQRWRCIGCTKSKKRSVTKDLGTTKHRIHDSVVSTLDQWQDQQLICK